MLPIFKYMYLQVTEAVSPICAISFKYCARDIFDIMWYLLYTFIAAIEV